MNSMEELLKDCAGFLQEVTLLSSQWIQQLETESTRDLVNYHPLNSGHMLRPLLVYITSSAFGEKISLECKQKLVYFAVSVELMHNASLLHDDLIDEEEIRRGKKSLFKEYGLKNALLAGNIFYIKAIEISNHYLESRQTADLLRSALSMCEGEVFQAQYENKQIPELDYNQIIRYKTGSLTALACRQAAAIVGGDEKTVELFGKLGEEIGVMYQLRDDRKDQDVNLESQIAYNDRIDSSDEKILFIMEELSKTQKLDQFKEIIAYFKKS